MATGKWNLLVAADGGASVAAQDDFDNLRRRLLDDPEEANEFFRQLDLLLKDESYELALGEPMPSFGVSREAPMELNGPNRPCMVMVEGTKFQRPGRTCIVLESTVGRDQWSDEQLGWIIECTGSLLYSRIPGTEFKFWMVMPESNEEDAASDIL